MRTPKMLPWLARKAAISDARAEALWAEAIEYVATTPFEPRPGAGDELAVKRLLTLLEAEAHAAPHPRVQNPQSREPWPVSRLAAIKTVAEDTLLAATVS